MLQSLFNGAIQGMLLAIVSLSFSLVYSTTRIFHIALGAIYAIAPYMLLSGIGAGFSWFAGAALAIGGCIVLGLCAEWLIHWPLEQRGAPSEVHFISSLGAFLIVGQIVVIIWGNDPRVLVAGADVVQVFAGIRATGGQLVGGGVSMVALLLFFAWLKLSDVGLQFRAMASNPSLLATVGRDVRKLRWAVFAISGALAAVAAILAARDVGFDPNVGMQTVLIGVAGAIIGGRGSFLGAAIAGFALGVLRAQVGWHFSPRWEDATTFLALSGFMLFAPGGLASLVRGNTKRLEDSA